MIETNVATVRRPTVEYVERVLTEMGVPVDSGVEGGRTRVPATTLYRLWDAAERRSADAAIGLRAAARMRASDFGVLGAVFEQASTLGDALVKLCRLLPLTSDSLRLMLVVNGSRTTLELVVNDPRLLHPRSAEHIVSMIGFAVQSRLPEREPFDLTAHWLHPAPAAGADFERVLGMRVQFDAGWNGLSFATEAMRTRRGGRQAQLDETRRLADLGLRYQRQPGLVVHVRDVIAAELGAGRPVTEAGVARQLALHPKSLARRLAARETTFQRQLDSVRFDRSRRLLEAGRSVDDVARRVGYADSTAFSRAFKRWSGLTPTAYAAQATDAASTSPGPEHA